MVSIMTFDRFYALRKIKVYTQSFTIPTFYNITSLSHTEKMCLIQLGR